MEEIYIFDDDEYTEVVDAPLGTLYEIRRQSQSWDCEIVAADGSWVVLVGTYEEYKKAQYKGRIYVLEEKDEHGCYDYSEWWYNLLFVLDETSEEEAEP